MIRISRCLEPAELESVRTAKLTVLRALGREPTSDDIDGYKLVAEHLWTSQHHKCCYCESKVPKSFNDVEHYRPKAAADRSPGSSAGHGYWWLAFSWNNLLFACPSCNRSGKNSQFPLALGSVPLNAEETPPGQEHPLLIDPGSDVNPVEHIEYVCASNGILAGPSYWWARPRRGSLLGNTTILVCKLNRNELLELRNDYVRDTVDKQVGALVRAIEGGNKDRVMDEYQRALGLLAGTNPYVGLAFDVLRARVSSAQLRRLIGRGWPSPRDSC